jgi:hypothetical protein
MNVGKQLLEREEVTYAARTIGEHKIDLRVEVIVKESLPDELTRLFVSEMYWKKFRNKERTLEKVLRKERFSVRSVPECL